jgi:hypothetical protein
VANNFSAIIVKSEGLGPEPSRPEPMTVFTQICPVAHVLEKEPLGENSV